MMTFRIIPLILLLPSIHSYTPLSSEYNLEFVSAIFRHGDRTPVLVYPDSAYQESFWPQGFSQLTTTGMREEHHLGEIYKDLYVETGFLSKNYTRVEVYIQSTDVDRTLMSGESMLSGLYPPDSDQQFKSDLPWQPIPVHTVPEIFDQLLRGRTVYCPEYQRLLDLDKTTDEYKKLEEDNKDLFEMLRQYTGVSYTVSNLWNLADELFVERTHGLTLPSWYSDELFDRMSPLQDYSIYLFSNTDKKRKITGGVWVNQVITNMQKKANGSDDIKNRKAIFYSAHDTTVSGMLSVFYMYNGIQPQYSSSFNIELYSKDDEYFVKFRYRNDTFSDDFIDLTHPDCPQDPCPLDQLERVMSEFMLTEDDRKLICQIQSSNGNKNGTFIGLSVAFGICGLFLVITLFVMVIVLITACRQRRKIMRYKKLTASEEM